MRDRGHDSVGTCMASRSDSTLGLFSPHDPCVDGMATVSFKKLLVNIPQLKSEKDWLVWKFQ